MIVKLPPSPKRSYNFPAPQIRSLRFVFNPLQVTEEDAKNSPDCFSLSRPNSPPVVYFYHPEAIKQIFTAPPECFKSSSGKILIPVVGYNSLIVTDGDRHQGQRKLLMPPFHGARMQTYAELITQITKTAINKWQTNKPFNVRETIQEISLQTILGAVFGLDSNDHDYELQHLLTSLVDSISSPVASTMLYFPGLQKDLGAWSPWGRFQRMKQKIDRLLLAKIEQRRTEADLGNDILSLLLSARDSQGQPMTNEELKDELLTLLFAGHETTASAIAWAVYWIERSPQVKAKLQQELSSISITDNPVAVTKLEYLTAIVQETLRIYPIAINTFPRTTVQPMKILDYQFEAGTIFFASIYLTHRRPDIYPEPNCFEPERFLSRQFSAYEYLPFGGGSRLCIGYAFAQFEMKLVLANIFSQFELTRVGKQPIKPTRRGVTIAPPGNLRMVAEYFPAIA